MPARAIPNKKMRGRPRSSNTERAILKAAGEIVLASGLDEMTIEGVAERAGVGKASIYRRWPSKGALAFDAVLDGILATQPTPDTGTLEGDLVRVAENWVQLSNVRRGGRTVANFIAEVQSDPGLAIAWRERFVDPIRKARRPIIERAIARGEIPAGSEIAGWPVMLASSVLYTSLGSKPSSSCRVRRPSARKPVAETVGDSRTPSSPSSRNSSGRSGPISTARSRLAASPTPNFF